MFTKHVKSEALTYHRTCRDEPPARKFSMAPDYPMSGTLRDGEWIKNVPSTYTPSQVCQYLSYIGYEPHFAEEAITSGAFPTNLENLERIMRLHLLTIPFENTAMH